MREAVLRVHIAYRSAVATGPAAAVARVSIAEEDISGLKPTVPTDHYFGERWYLSQGCRHGRDRQDKAEVGEKHDLICHVLGEGQRGNGPQSTLVF